MMSYQRTSIERRLQQDLPPSLQTAGVRTVIDLIGPQLSPAVARTFLSADGDEVQVRIQPHLYALCVEVDGDTWILPDAGAVDRFRPRPG